MFDQQRICRRAELNAECVSSEYLQEPWLSSQDGTPHLAVLISESCKCQSSLLKKVISGKRNLRVNTCAVPRRLLLRSGTVLNFLLSSMKSHRPFPMRN